MAQLLAKQLDEELDVPRHEGPTFRKPWVLEWSHFSLPTPYFLLLCFKLANKEWTEEPLGTPPLDTNKGRAPDLLSCSLTLFTWELAVWPMSIRYTSGPQGFCHQGPVTWKTIFPWTVGGDAFGMIQAHYIYCALYFY